MNLDVYLFGVINSYAKKSRVLDFLGIFCAKYLAYVIIVVLFAFSYIGDSKMHSFLWAMAAGIVSVLIVNEISYIFYKRHRPMEQVPDSMLISKPLSPAFPSSHTSFFFALSFVVLLYHLPMGLIFVALSFCISLSRIFCGVHWPSDILGGMASAGISFLVIVLIRNIF